MAIEETTVEKINRIETTLLEHIKAQTQSRQQLVEELDQSLERLIQLESNLDRLAVKQFQAEEKQEEFKEAMRYTTRLLMESSLNNLAALRRMDGLEADRTLLSDQLKRLSDTVDRYIAFRTNGSNGAH